MQHDPAAYLFDMRESCARLRRFTQGKRFDDYIEDEMLQAAVERQFEILGEALAQLYKISPEIAGRISDYRRVIDFRNLLIHGYATVSSTVVWGIVESHLETLCTEVDELLAQLVGEDGE